MDKVFSWIYALIALFALFIKGPEKRYKTFTGVQDI